MAEAKLAVVTGSTSGFGLEIARKFARRGCHVIITGFADEETIGTIKQSLTTAGAASCTYIPANLRSRGEIQSMCQEIDQRYPEGPAYLVNNAGFNHVGEVDGYPVDLWDDSVDVMLTAPFLLCRHFLSAMKKKGYGRIVNIASQMALISAPGKAVYSAVKHGLVGLTKGIAVEVGQYGITCNAVCPGFADTPLLRKQMEAIAQEKQMSIEEVKESISQGIPTRGFVELTQVAELVDFLCFSEAGVQINGAAYLIEGGFSIQ